MANTVADRQRLELMIAEGKRVVAEAKKQGLHLRLLGAIAFQIHCPNFNILSVKLNRVLTDIDFAGYGKERSKLINMMKELGYSDETSAAGVFSRSRILWDNKSNGIHIDIFLDKLEMNHIIPFDNRLNLDEFTIPLADMLLEKMQIVQINEKDVIDTIMLLREHTISEHGQVPETIDAHYIARLLSKDWGFYHTVTTNLAQVQSRLPQYKELNGQDVTDLDEKIRELLNSIEKEPKPLGWKLKAKIDPHGKSYRHVEEVAR